MSELPSLLDCYCGEKHYSYQCPNLDMAKLLELGRLEIAKCRLMRDGVSFQEWSGENDDGWWHFVQVNTSHDIETIARQDRIQALDGAIRYASMAQARAEVSKGSLAPTKAGTGKEKTR